MKKSAKPRETQPITIRELKRLASLLPRTYIATSSGEIEWRHIFVTATFRRDGAGPGAWYIVEIEVRKKDPGELPLFSTFRGYHQERTERAPEDFGVGRFYIATQRGREKPYKTLQALLGDVIYVFGEQCTIEIRLQGLDVAESRRRKR